MSGSFSPDEGRGPYEGRDLDDLLSGHGDSFPEGLRRALDALRGAPLPAELGDEAQARAAFRKIMLQGAGESPPAWPASGSGDSRTRILSTGAAGDRRHAAPGRHRRRSLPQRGRWRSTALVAAAAAVVVAAGAAALTSTLSSSGGPPAAVASAARARSVASAATSPGSNSVQGSGTPEATAKPTQASSAQSQSGPSSTGLCREYFDFFADPGQQSNSTEEDVLAQLSSQAGGTSSVYYYCTRLLQPWAAPQRPGSSRSTPGYPIPSGLPGLSGAQGSQGAGGSGNSQGGNGSGFGGKH